MTLEDRITAVDGQPMAEVAKLKQMFRGRREYLIGVRRGKQMLQIKIRLRRML
jgi:hypothetical protein